MYGYDAEPYSTGVSKAFVPGRNGIFLWHAANIAARRWPNDEIALVIGANVDDAAGFPDCRAEFFRALEESLFYGVRRGIRVSAPWVERGWRKAEILGWASARPDALADIRRSVSCYVGIRCGACDACTLRARAFADRGLTDGGSR